MRIASLLATTFSVLAAAASSSTTTVPYFFPEFPVTIPYYASTAASVAGINALATTYEIKCLKDAPKSDCDIAHPWTLIQGPATFSFTGVYTAINNALTATRDLKCTYTSTSLSASCSISYEATGSTSGASYSTGTVFSTSPVPTDSISYYGMLVTAGIESFTAPQATQTPGAAGAPPKPLITAVPLGAAAAVAVAALI